MTAFNAKSGHSLAGAFVSAIALAAVALPGALLNAAPPVAQKPASELTLSIGRGQLINLPAPISDVLVANEAVADVQVRSPTQVFVFGRAAGETSIYATTKSGAVVFSANVRVGANANTVEQMLRLAMPEAEIRTTNMNGMVLLTGTVQSPGDSEEAERLVQAYVGENTKVVSRLRTATPLTVNLQVKIAEVSRSLVKEFGVNLLTRDTTSGFQFGIAQGRNFGSIKDADLSGFPKLDASDVFGLPKGTISLPFDPKTGQFITGGTAFDFSRLANEGKTAVGLASRLFGLDVATALDMAEQEGLVTTLAQPNLTALSGETASFLAGGEFPIPISQQQGQVTIEYKQYGVSLSFTPTVLDNGRISMRVRPEVSELSTEGTVRLNGFDVPGVTTRRAETTVELGSGQSFMIGGLLQNSNRNIVDRTPGAGNVPVLGALFRSTRYRKNETELVIVVTPYLVKPVSANEVVLPTDGYKAPTDIERLLLGRMSGKSDQTDRPKPTMEGAGRTVQPQFGATEQGAVAPALASRSEEPQRPAKFEDAKAEMPAKQKKVKQPKAAKVDREPVQPEAPLPAAPDQLAMVQASRPEPVKPAKAPKPPKEPKAPKAARAPKVEADPSSGTGAMPGFSGL